MQTRLDRADRVRKEFVANASHELRTPLFSLGGFLELLDDEDIDDDTRAAFLRQMREQVNRLTKLATDLLDLSRLDADAVGGGARADRPGRRGAWAGARVPRAGRRATAAASRWCSRTPTCRTRSATSCGCSRSAGRCSTTPSGTTRRARGARRGHRRQRQRAAGGGRRRPRHRRPRPPATCSSGSTAARPPARPAAASAWPSPASWPSGWTGGWSCVSERWRDAVRVQPAGRARAEPAATCDRTAIIAALAGLAAGVVAAIVTVAIAVLERRLRRIDHRDHGRRGDRSPRST